MLALLITNVSRAAHFCSSCSGLGTAMRPHQASNLCRCAYTRLCCEKARGGGGYLVMQCALH